MVCGIGSLSRAVYMAGPYNELAAILSAATPSDFAVNLPAAIGQGSGGGIGMSLGSVGGNVNLGTVNALGAVGRRQLHQ